MSWHHEAPERALAGYRLLLRIIGFPSTTLRIDFDADLAFVGHLVD
jgi:hypothetical protein